MSRRKSLRAIAKANMESLGMKHFNRQQSTVKHPNGKTEQVNKSTFALKWKKFID